MPNYKVVFQYTQPSKGWTEVYYRTQTDLASASFFPEEFLLGLLALRDPLTVLNKVRVSDTLNNRTSVVVQINRSSGGSSFGPEPAGVACLVNLFSPTQGSSRKVWIRGLPDSAVLRSELTGIDQPSAALLSAISNFITELSRYTMTIRSLVRVGPPPNNYTTINSVGSVAGAGSVILNTIPGPVLNVGQLVLLNQINQKVFPGLKGLFSVTASTASSISVAYNSSLTAVTLLTKGRYRQANYNYGLIGGIAPGFAGFSTRSTGRNPLGGRGAKRGVRGLRSQ